MFNIFTCPRNVIVQPGLLRVIPYFIDYVTSGCREWPCGTRYHTPTKLQSAFEMLLTVYNQEFAKTKDKPE